MALIDPDKMKRLVEKAKEKGWIRDEEKALSFVLLDLSPRWKKCGRTRRLVFTFHRLGEGEGKTLCGKELKEFQVLPQRQEELVITQVNTLLGGLGLLVFFDLCGECFANLSKCKEEA